MANLVVDASVAAKWILPERGSERAAEFLAEPRAGLHSPELCVAELTNTLWKRVRRREMTGDEAVRAMSPMRHLPLELHSHGPLVSSALLLALEQEITMYDALYIALALRLDATVLTADRRLAAAALDVGLSVELV